MATVLTPVFRCEIFSKMSSKFNVNIQGGSGSIVMGDNTSVNISSRRSNSGKMTVFLIRCNLQPNSQQYTDVTINKSESNYFYFLY